MAKMQSGEQIDLNTASVEDVVRIPNIGQQSARALIAARPDEGFAGWAQVRKLVSGWGPFTVSLAEPYCVFGAGSEPEMAGEDIEDPDVVEQPQEPEEQEPAPKARRRRRTKAA
jgi:hypothetical protein